MRLLKAGLLLLIILPMVVILPSSSAQRLYDKRRDEQAQEAQKYIDPLLSGSVFDAQLKNLALLSKQDLEALLLGAKYETRSKINSFSEWRHVNCFVARLKAKVIKTDQAPTEAERTALIKELKDKIKGANEELKELKAEAACKKDPKKCLTPEQAAACEKQPNPKPKSCTDPDATAIDAFFEGVNELEELGKQVDALELKPLSPGVIKAGEKIKGVLDELEKAFKNYRERMNAYNHLQGELLDLRITLKQIAIQTLQVEAEHLINIGEIRARREFEETEIEDLISEYEELADPGQLDLGYETDAKCFCPRSEDDPRDQETERFCSTITDSDQIERKIERNIEMTLRDAVRKARDAEAALVEAEATLQKAQRDLDEAKAHAQEEEARLIEAVRRSRGVARRRAMRALAQAREDFRRQEERLKDAVSGAQKNIPVAKQNMLDTRNRLEDRLEVLFMAASLASYGRLPDSVAKQRLAQEDHAYSIRLSRVRARAYQLTVSTGVQRLALYHKGGIKPSLVARLVHAASTVAIAPILAAQ